MGGLAVLAKQLGYEVTGSDVNVYPPMSTQLTEAGITLMSGYTSANLSDEPDLIVVGNAISRGNPEIEAVLDKGLAYTSGPQWLYEHVLKDRWVLAVSGTHGKTTTSAMLAWILDQAGMNPGFLIGGVPKNFGISARIGGGKYFVIEADEYDTAFFDKRSKFVHYRPKTAILNNLEFDHADIFPDIDAIKLQFHHLIRMVPSSGLLIAPGSDTQLADVLDMGCWTPIETISSEPNDIESDWLAISENTASSQFKVRLHGIDKGSVQWQLIGEHNVSNGLAAIAAAHHVGIQPEEAIGSLSRFENVKRRMEIQSETNGVIIYDDFAHHPTAIQKTLEGLRGKVGDSRIVAIVEPRSNTMRLGFHQDTLGQSLAAADTAIIYKPQNVSWSIEKLAEQYSNLVILDSIDEIIDRIAQMAMPGDSLVFMSNGGFSGIHKKVEEQLKCLSAVKERSGADCRKE